MKQAEIYKLALEKWGEGLQIIMAIEEMAELTQVLAKIIRAHQAYSRTDLPEEIADVEITLAQLRVVYPGIEKEVQRWKRIKKRRLLKDIKQTQNKLNFEEKK